MRTEISVALNNMNITDGSIQSCFCPNLVLIGIHIIAPNALSMNRVDLMTLSLEAFIKDTFSVISWDLG